MTCPVKLGPYHDDPPRPCAEYENIAVAAESRTKRGLDVQCVGREDEGQQVWWEFRADPYGRA